MLRERNVVANSGYKVTVGIHLALAYVLVTFAPCAESPVMI